MGDEENIFTFDIKPFTQGLKKVLRGIGTMVVAFKGLNSVIKEMPEIGQAFKIGKEVIMKNILFPLRKELFPLLQQFLDWVRDNRAMFIKWGQTLVGIFKAVASGVKLLIDLGQDLAKSFIQFINKTFGFELKTFQDLLNVFSFKIAVIIEFLKALSKPLFDIFKQVASVVGKVLFNAIQTVTSLIGGFFSELQGVDKIFKSILDNVFLIVNDLLDFNKTGNGIKKIFQIVGGIFGKIVKFVLRISDGFIKGITPHVRTLISNIKKLMTPISGIVEAFKKIFDFIFGSNEALKNWESVFKFLGDVVGTVLVEGFRIIEGAVKLIKAAVDGIVGGFKWLKDNIDKIFKKPGFAVAIPGVAGGLLKVLPGVNDALITKRGEVVPLNPNDNVLAFQDKLPRIDSDIDHGKIINRNKVNRNEFNISVDFTGMQVVLQQGTIEQAKVFSESLVSQFRGQLNKELERVGKK